VKYLFIDGSKLRMPLKNPIVNSYMGKAILLFTGTGGAILLFAGTGGAVLTFAVYIDHPPALQSTQQCTQNKIISRF
jgi:hypothetical protein